MNVLFADTSYFLALLDRSDAFHLRAQPLSNTEQRSMVTTSAIILELGAALSHGRDRLAFLDLLDVLQKKHAIVVSVDESLQDRAIQRFRSRPDKHWSLADCVSFVVMEDRQITDAATSDKHFQEAGFTALLRQINI